VRGEARPAAPARPTGPQIPLPDVLSAPTLPGNVLPVQCPPTTLIGAMLAVKLGLEEAITGLAGAVAFLTDPLFVEVVGEGASAKNPGVTTIEVIQHSLELVLAGVEWTIGQVNNCYEGIFLGVTTTEGNMQILGEDVQILAQGENRILHNAATLSAAIDAGFGKVDTNNAGLQNSVNTAQAALDAALRQHIEAALTSGRPDVDFELPASAGGYLDATPIGVQQIVTDALAALRANGQPVDVAAPRYLTLANNALTAQHYKAAYHYYQLAYQAITR
jgi:hypothetical protein